VEAQSDFTKAVRTSEASAAVPQLSFTHRTGIVALCAYLVLVFSRGTEVLAVALGVNLHIAMILLSVIVASGVAGGQLIRVLQSKITVFLALTTAWFLLAVPFSPKFQVVK